MGNSPGENKLRINRIRLSSSCFSYKGKLDDEEFLFKIDLDRLALFSEKIRN